MAKPRPSVTIRKPGKAPTEDAIRELEERADARQAAPAGASLQARKPARNGASSRDRAFSKDKPYVRRDGTATRGTTVYLPVEMAEQLRGAAFKTGRRQNEIVVEAISSWLEQQARDATYARKETSRRRS